MVNIENYTETKLWMKTDTKQEEKKEEESKELYLCLRINWQLLTPYLDYDAVSVNVLDKRK